jgi:hypothetical protein
MTKGLEHLGIVVGEEVDALSRDVAQPPEGPATVRLGGLRGSVTAPELALFRCEGVAHR